MQSRETYIYLWAMNGCAVSTQRIDFEPGAIDQAWKYSRPFKPS